jgi:hypothetical protein
MMAELPYPFLLFLGDTTEPAFAKTAFGLRDWAPERCIGEYSLGGAAVTTGLPRFTPQEAYQRGARGLVIGVDNYGGVIQDDWVPVLLDALEVGLDLVSGMHAKLQDVELLRSSAARLVRRLIDTCYWTLRANE